MNDEDEDSLFLFCEVISIYSKNVEKRFDSSSLTHRRLSCLTQTSHDANVNRVLLTGCSFSSLSESADSARTRARAMFSTPRSRGPAVSPARARLGRASRPARAPRAAVPPRAMASSDVGPAIIVGGGRVGSALESTPHGQLCHQLPLHFFQGRRSLCLRVSILHPQRKPLDRNTRARACHGCHGRRPCRGAKAQRRDRGRSKGIRARNRDCERGRQDGKCGSDHGYL